MTLDLACWGCRTPTHWPPLRGPVPSQHRPEQGHLPFSRAHSPVRHVPVWQDGNWDWEGSAHPLGRDLGDFTTRVNETYPLL